ncbi:MAG: S8 family serine peptidase, partial [Marinobacter sp.]|nr:S8 family serine peptidase [Marinobacter sp.]
MMRVRMVGRLLGLGFMTAMLSSCGGGSGGGLDSTSTDVSGTITIESGTRVDSDTADDSRLGVAVENNSRTSAQDLPDASITGGYLSATGGSYPSDGSFNFVYPVDSQDTYRILLTDGSRVVVQPFRSEDTTAVPNVSLSILNASNAEVCNGTCNGAGSSVLSATINSGSTTPEAYTVAVHADSGGPFRYVLTVTPPGSAATSLSAGYDQVDFVPDEAIVSMDAGAGGQSGASAMTQALGVATARALGHGLWQLSRVPASVARPLSGAARAQAQVDTLAWIRDLQKRPDVILAEPNYLYQAQQITPDNDPLYARQWHYPLINLPLAWQLVPGGGAGVGVAVMDTGLFSMTPATYGNWHPDLNANVIGFDSQRILDYVTGDLDIDNSPGIRDNNPADPGDGQPQASSFHGTHVAGTIAAVDNSIGGLGVAPSATLIPVRVLGRNGTGSGADLIAALNWAATQPEIDVVNLSLGGLGPSTALKSAIDAVYSRGKLIVAAAGNQGTDSLTYPAAYSNVIGVGAVDGAATRASYSNYGGSVDLVAPGGDASRDANLDGNADVVISTWGDDSSGTFVPAYAGLQGTSMAAP